MSLTGVADLELQGGKQMGILCDWLGEHVLLPLVGPDLEEGTELRKLPLMTTRSWLLWAGGLCAAVMTAWLCPCVCSGCRSLCLMLRLQEVSTVSQAEGSVPAHGLPPTISCQFFIVLDALSRE